MIAHAPTDSGRRYVAASICACRELADSVSASETSTLQRLQSLAEMWFSHLLWVCWPNTTVYERVRRLPRMRHRLGKVRTVQRVRGRWSMVLRRDAYRCAITGVLSALSFNFFDLPEVTKQTTGVSNAHILKRAVGQVPREERSAAYRSAVCTWDILKQYGALGDLSVHEASDMIDEPPNGIGGSRPQ
ncbi:hypothetical protein PLICRDRAFT_323730 [Plicaturopsis crispa FD-325 SS-3]|nr:hypothetical protein PLICRDRAFT_323730 [Plicaturopsis crispa FD-325 SS-3]